MAFVGAALEGRKTMATMAGRSFDRVGAIRAGARWATVRVETDGGVYVGRVHIPDARTRVSDVLADDRQFLSLTDVRVDEGAQSEAYLAVNKSFVRTLRILDEGLAAPAQSSIVPLR